MHLVKMIRSKWMCFWSLAALAGLALSATTIQMFEQQARNLFDQTQQELTTLSQQLLPILLKPQAELNFQDAMLLMVGFKGLTNKTKELAKNVKKLPYTAFQDEDLKRRIKLIGDLDVTVLDDDKVLETAFVFDGLKNISTARIVCDRDRVNRCNFGYLPHVRGIISNSQNADELKFYWAEWRDKIEVEAKTLVAKYIRYYREIAQGNGFNKPSSYYYSKFEDENLLEELKAVMEELRPLYQEFHAYIRFVLREQHGNDVVSEEGPIPLHLFEQTLLQAWKKFSILEHPYPDKRLPNVKEHLDANDYTSLRILQAGDLFYQSLGMGTLPNEFWLHSIRQMTNAEGGPDCKAEIFDFQRAIGMKYCPKPTFKKFLQTHGDMGKVRYAYNIADLPLGFSQEPCPGFSDALGESAILSSSTPRHLREMGLIPTYVYEPEIGLNRLFRMGVHTLLTVPMYFVYEKLTVGLIDGDIPLSDVNCAFWELMDEFLGVEPPVIRTNRNMDMTYRFYNGLDLEKRHTKKLVSEILGYQFYKAFCVKAGSYRPNDRNYPLDNCDYAGSTQVGQLMSNMMSTGAKRTWRDIIEPVVGTRRLSGRVMMEYYAPLKNWLQQQNQQNGVRVGWTKGNKCIR